VEKKEDDDEDSLWDDDEAEAPEINVRPMMKDKVPEEKKEDDDDSMWDDSGDEPDIAFRPGAVKPVKEVTKEVVPVEGPQTRSINWMYGNFTTSKNEKGQEVIEQEDYIKIVIGEKLGKGRFCTVKKAIGTYIGEDLDVPYAIKIYKKEKLKAIKVVKLMGLSDMVK
jgi:hypothetical protein